MIWRGPMLHKALEQFLTDVYWGEPDYLVIDMPPGTGDVSLSMAQFLPRAEVIVVTTPQPAAQRVAQRAAAMAEKVELDVIGVIENMSWFTGDDGKRYELFGSGGGAGARRPARRAAARRRSRWSPRSARAATTAARSWWPSPTTKRRRRSAPSPSSSTPSSRRSASTAPSCGSTSAWRPHHVRRPRRRCAPTQRANSGRAGRSTWRCPWAIAPS